MEFKKTIRNSLRAVALVCLVLNPQTFAKQQTIVPAIPPFPSSETLYYRIEWRMVTAGAAKLQLEQAQQNWQIHLKLESAGLVSRLFRIEDSYTVTVTDKYCGINSSFEAREGKRHVIETQQFDNAKHKAIFDSHDLVKNVKEHHELDIAPCTYDVVGALQSLRGFRIEPGKSITIPIANGKKMAYARIEAQARENITVDGKSYPTMRYEAFIFDNVVFRRKGSLLVWLSEDAARLPVQMRFQMGFPIGSIGLELEKVDRG